MSLGISDNASSSFSTVDVRFPLEREDKTPATIFASLCTSWEKPTSKSIKRLTETWQGMEFVSEIRYKGLVLVKYCKP